jgi:hypothetical protein
MIGSLRPRAMAALAAIFTATLACSTDASAQSPSAPCPAPRTIYTFTDSSSVQALAGAPGPFCRFVNLNSGQPVDLFLGAFSASSPVVRANISVLTSLLPLQVGKTANLGKTGPDGKAWQASVTVEGYESVRVPAGQLACFVLLWTEPSGTGKWERRWWYCPSLEYPAKYAAKFEVVGADGRTNTSSPTSWELAGVRVP